MSNKIEVVGYNNEQEEIREVELDDIKKLAKLAVSLESVPSESEVFGHVEALYYYFESNKNHELIDCYNALNSSKCGKTILCAVTELAFIMSKEEASRIRFDQGVMKFNKALEDNKISVENKKEELKNNKGKR